MQLDLFEILKVIFLGIVEGITEWLPISSTGHMLLVDEFLHLSARDEFKEMFFVVIQLGAILAVVLLFWNKMWPFQFRDKNRSVLRYTVWNMWFKNLLVLKTKKEQVKLTCSAFILMRKMGLEPTRSH